MIRKLSLLLTAASLTACSALWSTANRGALEADLRRVLDAPAEAPGWECSMVGTTRTGYCRFEADASWLRSAAEELGMQRTAVGLHDPAGLPPLQSEGLTGCLSAEVFGPAQDLPAYWLGGRPEALALESGGQFEYLLLLIDPATGAACAQAAYAYG